MNAMDTIRDGLVAALTPAPTLEEQLERAEMDLVRADYTESTAKMLREKEEARARIAAIRKQIAERDERQHLESAVSALGDNHAAPRKEI